MASVNVEGVAWGIEPVTKLDKTEEDFVLRHMDDEGTYPLMPREKKIATLKLVWQLCNPIQDNPIIQTKNDKNEQDKSTSGISGGSAEDSH